MDKIENKAKVLELPLLLLKWHSYGYKTGFERGKKEALQGGPSEKAKPPKGRAVALSTIR